MSANIGIVKMAQVTSATQLLSAAGQSGGRSVRVFDVTFTGALTAGVAYLYTGLTSAASFPTIMVRENPQGTLNSNVGFRFEGGCLVLSTASSATVTFCEEA